jgi:hypothetical protein
MKETCDLKNRVIVRTARAGVFMGVIHSRTGSEITLKNARRLWYWSGAASLSQIAMEGVKFSGKCKFPCEVPEITLLEVIEIIPCMEAAVRNINEVPIWEI